MLLASAFEHIAAVNASATHPARHHFNSLPSLLPQVLDHPRQVLGSILTFSSASRHLTIAVSSCLEEYYLVPKGYQSQTLAKAFSPFVVTHKRKSNSSRKSGTYLPITLFSLDLQLKL